MLCLVSWSTLLVLLAQGLENSAGYQIQTFFRGHWNLAQQPLGNTEWTHTRGHHWPLLSNRFALLTSKIHLHFRFYTEKISLKLNQLLTVHIAVIIFINFSTFEMKNSCLLLLWRVKAGQDLLNDFIGNNKSWKWLKKIRKWYIWHSIEETALGYYSD